MPVTRKANSSGLSSFSVYLQTCSVCTKEFSRRTDWLDHLLQKGHQQLAREECLKIWNNDFRKSCLIMFTSEPLNTSNCKEILEFFSGPIRKNDDLTIVTDFIWWEDRPKIGILQFESKEKAKLILKTFCCRDSKQIQIGDFISVHLKSGLKMQELEWKAILPLTEDEINEISPNKKLKLDKNVLQEANTSYQSDNIESLLTLQLPITPTSNPLVFQYLAIQNTIPVPGVSKASGNLKEVQLSRLLEYLCQFDPRCKPVVRLATYWLTMNSINISGDCSHTNSSMNLPSHCTIEWLVMFYLYNKLYVPTPKEIFNKTCKSSSDGESIHIDNKFYWDTDFVERWKLEKRLSPCLMDTSSEKCVLNVINLFWEFLNYSSSTFSGHGVDKVINTRDGKSISIETLLQTNSSNMLKSKRSSRWQKVMTLEEIHILKKAVQNEKSNKDFCGVYMTNPFSFSEKITMANDIKVSFKHFCTGYVKIGEFLSNVKKNGLKASFEQIESFQNMFTIVKKTFQ